MDLEQKDKMDDRTKESGKDDQPESVKSKDDEVKEKEYHSEETETKEDPSDAPEKSEKESAGESSESGEETSDESGKSGEKPSGESSESEEESADAGDGSQDKKGFFSKKKQRDKQDEKIADLTDKLQRNLAEFNNFRNRSEKEKAAMFDIGARSVIEKLLPIVDNFERGLASVPEEEKDSSFTSGMEMIYRQLTKMLDDIGVKEIDAVGKEFDPNLHNAVLHEESEDYGENIVAEVLQKGYTYHDIVIRHAMVKVVN